MGPLQKFVFWYELEKNATSAKDKANVHALMGLGRGKAKARKALEDKAKEAMAVKANEMGVSPDVMQEAEDARVGAVLPSGWFQVLLAALPQILAFVEEILKLFNIVPHKVA